MSSGSSQFFEAPAREGLDRLINSLTSRGFEVIGPTFRDGAIVLGRIDNVDDLPYGVRDQQEKGTYRAFHANSGAFFGYNLGPTGWKSYLFPPRQKLWSLQRGKNPIAEAIQGRPLAFLGVRACELAAITVLDKVFLRDGGDPGYRTRRESTLIIGVNCQTAAPTCFCPSMGSGPEFGSSGWDLQLTEHQGTVYASAGTGLGQSIAEAVHWSPTAADVPAIVNMQVAETTSLITRRMDQTKIKDTLYSRLASDRWEEIGKRCLSCANCTLVCPTCFCSTVEDVADVEGNHAERWQKWDSCFHSDFSYVHGGSLRVSTASRYRQWLSHKLASWHDQFGTSGCVGCGRCVAWCPVGIDITEEMAQIRLDSDAGEKVK